MQDYPNKTSPFEEMSARWATAAGLLTLFLLLLLASCARTVYVPVENVSLRSDTVIQTLRQTDTVLNSDTVRIRERGDSVIMEIVKWRTRIRESRDTVYRSKTDTIFKTEPYTVEVVREVPRSRGWWESALLWTGGIALASLALYAVWRRKKK